MKRELLLNGIVRVLQANGETAGTGFVLTSDGLIATCSHVIQSEAAQRHGEAIPEKRKIVFLASGEQREAVVVPAWWRAAKAEDVAILRVEGGLPEGVQPLPPGSSSGTGDHLFDTFGFPKANAKQGIWGEGHLLGTTRIGAVQVIQLSSKEVTPGFSGAPVVDRQRQRIVGMVTSITPPDEFGRLAETAFITPMEVLRTICPALSLAQLASPYRSLDAFTEADAPYFFGRQRVIQELIESLRNEERCLAVLGLSGCGKSSVIQAGLIPQLRQGVLTQSDRWHFIVTRPYDDPFQQLALTGLVSASHNLTEGVKAWLARNPQQSRLVLVIDQFEELFVSCTEAVSQAFVTQLTELIAGSLQVTVILTMRNDFYSRLAQHELLLKLLKRGLVNVPPTLSYSELIDIVRKPAASVGMQFEENLVETIVKDAMETSTLSRAKGRIAYSTVLPLLEFALTQLWERPEEGMLTHKAYHTIGEVTGGLTRWGDTAYHELADDEQRRLARRIFTDLVFLGDESQEIPNIRQSCHLSSLWRNSSEKASVQEVVRQLVAARLLVTSLDPKSNEETIEIIHDALLREWGQLRHWLEEDRRFLEWHQELRDKVQHWIKTNPADASGRDTGNLLQGHLLSSSAEWLKYRPADLNNEERDFIQTSLRHAKEEAQILRDLLEESELQRKRAEQQKQLAEQRRIEAEQQREEAKRQQRVAEQQREEAKRQQQVAEQQKQLSLARQLMAQAELLRSQQASLLQRSVLLAVEAIQRSPSPEANQALRQGLVLLPRPTAHLQPQDEIITSALGTQGQYLLTINKYATVEVWEVLSGQSIARLNHGTEVTIAAFSLDGRCVVTVGTDNTARIWETVSGHQLARLFNESEIKTVVLSQTGRYIAIISSDGRTKMYEWNAQGGRQLNPLTDKESINAVTFSPDGRYYATASIDCNVRVFEIASGHLVAQLPHGRSINALAFSPDTRFLSTVSDDSSNYSSVRLWLWRAKSNIKPALFSHEAPVNAVAFSADGHYLATASKDQTARIWEIASGRPFNRMRHEGSVHALVFSPDGRYLATTSEDRTVGIWETSSGYRLICLPHKDVGYKEKDFVHTIAFSKDGHSFTTASNNGLARVWEIINDRLNHKKSVNMVAFSPNGNYLASASDDNTAAVWEVKNGRRYLDIAHGGKVWAVAFSPNGHLLASACRDGSAHLVDIATGRQLFRLLHTTNVNTVAFSPSGQYLATASEDKTARLWETKSGREISRLSHEDSVYSVAFSPDGKLLATTCGDGTARVWDTDSGQQRFSLAHKPIINHIAFSPDGRYLATAGWNRSAKLWELARGQEVLHLAHSNKVWYVAFSQDSKYLATASEDSTARIWEVNGGREHLRLQHEGSVSAVAFSPGSQYLATASADRTARIWEAVTGNPLAYLKHEDSVIAIAFSPDGKYFATASGDDTAHIWTWQSKDLIIEACTRLTRNLTEGEWRQYFGEEPYTKTCPRL